MSNGPTFYHPGYHDKYHERGAKKLEAILGNIEPVQSILDIGCNTGYVSEGLLASGKAKHATGIELHREAVSPQLLARPDFTLFEGSAVDFSFNEVYDAVFYLSIHHHIFGGHGRGRAFQLWRDVVTHCNRYLFYEPALITEVGDYYWKDAIRRQFDDNDHWRLLKAAIGPRLKRLDCISRLSIHGVERPLYRIELYPLGSEHDLKPETVYGVKYGADDNWQVVRRLHRTNGRTNQRLVEDGKQEKGLYLGTEFFELRNAKSGELAFGKKIHEDPYRQMREFMILEQARHPRVVPVLAVTPSYGLIFPYYDWPTLESVRARGITNTDELWKEISGVLEEVLGLEIRTGFLDLDPDAYNSQRHIGDIIDMHASNVLVQIQGKRVVDWRLIDFEYFSNTNHDRNMLKHREAILRKIMKLRGIRGWLRQVFFKTGKK